MGERLTEASIWVWWGLTRYRCDWTWNPEADRLKLTRATCWWGRYGETSQKLFLIEQKALRDRLDRARLMLALSTAPAECVKAADDVTKEKRDRHATLFGLLAYAVLLFVCAGAFKLMRSWGLPMSDELLGIPAVIGLLVFSPASDWYRSRGQ